MRNIHILFLAALLLLSGCGKMERLDASGAEPVWPDYAIVTEEPPPMPTAPEETAPPTVVTEPTETEPVPQATEPTGAGREAAAAPATEPSKEYTAPAQPEPKPTAPAPARSAEPKESLPEATQPPKATGMQQTTLTLPDGTTANCWLYVPGDPAASPGLIVYLHGGSGKGSDLDLITQVDGFPQYLKTGQLGTLSDYVLIPQLPKDKKGWSDMDGTLISIVQTVVRDYGIDSGNISLTGHSMGGTGTWAIAAAHPGFFARIAPLSGSIRDTSENLDALMHTPVYTFVGTEDTIVPPESTESFVADLNDSGGNAILVKLQGVDHFSVPSLAYLGNYGLVDWLLGK